MSNKIWNLFRQTAGQVTVLLGLVFATPTAAADLDFTQVGHWPETVVDQGWGGAAMVGRHAFVAGFSGVYAFDVGEPAPFRVLGTLKTIGGNSQIVVAGNHAFVTDDEGRMLVVDISDPTHLRLVTVYPKGGAMAVSGSHVYLLRSGEIEIVDISDPAHPQSSGAFTLEREAYVMAADGDFLCTASTRFDGAGDMATLEVIDIRNPAALRRVGIYEAPGNFHAVAVSGGRAYFAPYTVNNAGTRLSKVEVIDLTDPAGPKRLGTYSTTGEVWSLCPAGRYLYVGKDIVSGGGRVAVDILDLSDPAKPVRVGGYTGTTEDYTPFITVAGGLACLRSNSGLISFDVSEPTVLRRLGTLVNDGNYFPDMAVSGNHAYVTSNAGKGLQVLDVSDPSNVRRVGGVSLPGLYAFRVVVSGNHAHVAAADGVFTIDVSNPASPRRTSTYGAGDAFHDLAISGNLLCAVGYEGLHVLDLTNPARPGRLGSSVVRYMGFREKSVAISGNHVFVTSSDNVSVSGVVEVFDVSSPSSPQWVGSYDTPGIANGIAVSGNLAVVTGRRADSTMFVEILDVGNPGSPMWIASHAPDEGAWAEKVAILGNRAFIGHSGGLEVLDLSEPARPRRVGGLHSFGSRFAVSGDYLFAARNGFYTLRMSAPALDLSGTFKVGDRALGVAVEGSIGYLATSAAGLQVVDLAKPELPVALGNLPTVGKAWDVAVAGGRGYVAAGDAGLVIADVSNPASPQSIGAFDTAGDARAVLVSGTIAYVADGREGVQVLDVSDPAQSRRIGGQGTTGQATGLALHGKHLLVACREAGLLLLDVNNPADPRTVATYNRGGYVMAVAVSGNHALVADGLEGFAVLDLTDPAKLQRIGVVSGGGYARSIVVSGRFAYVADAQAGVQVYDITDPTQPRRMGGNSALEAYRLVVSGGRLFAAGGQSGLGMFDLFTPPLGLRALPEDSPGTLRLSVDGPPKASVRLERSADLRTWQDWRTVTLENLPRTLTDSTTGSETQRFYRAVQP